MDLTLPLLAQEGALTADQLKNFGALLPEYFLCAMVIVMLLIDLIRGKGPDRRYPWITLAGVVVAMGLVFTSSSANVIVGYESFGSMHVDGLAQVFKLIFLATGALTVLFIARSGQTYAHEGEFHVIFFGALAGMCYLASSADVISFYLAFETVSYTGFLMAGYRLESGKGAEAAGKYVIFGSVASAVMLFGLTLVYGFTGSMQFPVIAERLLAANPEPGLMVGAVFVFGGFAFKAAAFPFHFWCPDVYEGAPAPIAGFLAVASKAAAFAVGVRALGYGFEAGALDMGSRLTELFNPNGSFLQNLLIVASIGTMTWGNLAALRQTNVQRMLAYSSIAHAGYLLMTCAVIGQGSVGADATTAVVFYLLTYLFMNLGAFFIVTLMRRDLRSTELPALRGAARRHPFLAICFTVILFSLTGLPPTAGFLGKFLLFAPVVKQGLYLLALVGLLNGAVSLYYYALPLKEMFLSDPGTEERRGFSLALPDKLLVGMLTAPLLLLVLFGWSQMMDLAGQAVAMVR